MRKGSKMKKWLFKLEQDVNLDMPTAWSGYVRCDGNKAAAKRAIAKKLHLERLPTNTVVVSQGDLKYSKPLTPTTVKRKAPAKALADVPMSFDEVQDMLKKLWL